MKADNKKRACDNNDVGDTRKTDGHLTLYSARTETTRAQSKVVHPTDIALAPFDLYLKSSKTVQFPYDLRTQSQNVDECPYKI